MPLSKRRMSSNCEATRGARRVWATEKLVSRCADADRAADVSWLRANVMGPDEAVWTLRITARDRYSDRCWSWGRTAGYCVGMRYRSPRKALEQCNAIRHSFGRVEQYACVAAPQRFLLSLRGSTRPSSGTVCDLPSARASADRRRPYRHGWGRAVGTADRVSNGLPLTKLHHAAFDT